MQQYQIKIYFETWSHEDIEAGATNKSGEHDLRSYEKDRRDEEDTPVQWAIKELQEYGRLEPSSSVFHQGIWYSTRTPAKDFRSGDQTNYSLHLKGFTREEEEAIYTVVKG